MFVPTDDQFDNALVIVSIKGEARYQVIGNTRSGQDPSGLVFTGG